VRGGTRSAEPQRFRLDPVGEGMGAIRDCSCRRLPRRAFLADLGMGVTGLALGALLVRAGYGLFADAAEPWSAPAGRPHFAPRAKRVIWLFMIGGTSHLES